MPACQVGTTWTLVTHDREAVLAALRRGECDGLLPAACGFMDEFAGFLNDKGIMDLLNEFPDPRTRRSIAAAFFCIVLMHKALFRIDSLRKIGAVLFQSPDILRKLGFNLRQINEGFYVNSQQQPFNEEALADYFAALEPEQLCAHQLELSHHLLKQCPQLLSEGVAMIDAVSVTVPPGHHGRAGMRYKVCVLAIWHDGRLYPLLWDFTRCGPGEDAELTQAKRLVEAARRLWGKHAIRRLVLDRGYIDGAWISELKRDGVNVVIGLKTDMVMYQDMMGLAQLDDAQWIPAAPPKLHDGPLPERSLCCLEHLETWDACTVPLHGCVVRDQYPTAIRHQCFVTTDETLTGPGVHQAVRERWQIEETFMDLTRYWNLERFGSCRPTVAAAQVHFTFLAYTLLQLYEAQAAQPQPTPPPGALVRGRELVVYWQDRFAILWPSELLAIMYEHFEAWSANKDAILQAVRFTEGSHRPRAPD